MGADTEISNPWRRHWTLNIDSPGVVDVRKKYSLTETLLECAEGSTCYMGTILAPPVEYDRAVRARWDAALCQITLTTCQIR